MLLIEYVKIIIFFLTATAIVLLLVTLPRVLNKKFILENTFRPVECGSQSFGSGKNKIEIIFYRVLIVFIIFEIEVLVIIPWVFNFYLVFEYSFFLFIFIIILLLVYIYEYNKNIFKF